MTWSQRLKRVFNIEIETSTQCHRPVEVNVCIEDPVVINHMLAHLTQKAGANEPSALPESRAPPMGLFA